MWRGKPLLMTLPARGPVHLVHVMPQPRWLSLCCFGNSLSHSSGVTFLSFLSVTPLHHCYLFISSPDFVSLLQAHVPHSNELGKSSNVVRIQHDTWVISGHMNLFVGKYRKKKGWKEERKEIYPVTFEGLVQLHFICYNVI